MAYTQLIFSVPGFDIHMNIHIVPLCMCWVAFINFTATSCMPRSPTPLSMACCCVRFSFFEIHFWFMHSNWVCLPNSCAFTLSLSSVVEAHTHISKFVCCCLWNAHIQRLGPLQCSDVSAMQKCIERDFHECVSMVVNRTCFLCFCKVLCRTWLRDLYLHLCSILWKASISS